jgi:transcriptional regulator with XRE-family HTH domain
MRPVLFREELGAILRTARTNQNRTLRDVADAACVSLGYLSELERGRKEASSEMLNSICEALGMQLWQLLAAVAKRIAVVDNTPQMVQPVQLARAA